MLKLLKLDFKRFKDSLKILKFEKEKILNNLHKLHLIIKSIFKFYRCLRK